MKVSMVGALALVAMAGTFGGCASKRGLPIVYMPDPPKECEYVMNGVDGKSGTRLFEVEPYPRGSTTTGQVNVWLAKEGATRKNEREISRVCAEYALKTAGVMADGDKPKGLSGGVNETPSVAPAPKTKPSKVGSSAAEGNGANRMQFVAPGDSASKPAPTGINEGAAVPSSPATLPDTAPASEAITKDSPT